MIRTWLQRRYVEADYRFLEALHGHGWDEGLIKHRLRIRVFWAFMGGKS